MTRRQAQKAQTRANVLAAATLMFEHSGYEATTMRAVAKQAGMSTGAIFANWSSKDALYLEIYGHPPITPEVGRRLLLAAKNAGLNAAIEAAIMGTMV